MASFGVEYRSRAQLPSTTHHWWRGVLGVAQFGLDSRSLGLLSVPLAAVPLRTCGDNEALYEVWRADGSMQTGVLGRVRYRCNSDLLFGCISLPEPRQDRAKGSPLQVNTRAAYGEIFATLKATGYQRLVRVWNYVSDIARPAPDGERYWHFNNARYESFVASERPMVETAPAASALGTPRGSPLVIYFLANRTTAQMLENPRQVSAYRYPEQYGPRSPTFSRAALLAEGGGTLMISGTASIVGHETVHSGDAAAQTRESLANIGALTDSANRHLAPFRFNLESLSFKVYVRDMADLPVVERVMQEVTGTKTPVGYLRADLCRRDLLVEIEAVGSSPSRSYKSARGPLSCTVS